MIKYLIEPTVFEDPETLKLANDASLVWGSVYQGMAPVGDWLQARVASLLRDWGIGPDWCISHGQLFNRKHPDLQTRSWDLIIHRRPPDNCRQPNDSHLPPPATDDGPWVLLPTELCAAVIDTKGRYESPRRYAQAAAFDGQNKSTVHQLELLVPHVKAALLILASARPPTAVMDEDTEGKLSAFVLAQAKDHKGAQVTDSVTWTLTLTQRNTSPLQDFKTWITEAVGDWHRRNH